MPYELEYVSGKDAGIEDGQAFHWLTPMSVHEGFADREHKRPIVVLRFKEFPNHGVLFECRKSAEVFCAGIMELVEEHFPKVESKPAN